MEKIFKCKACECEEYEVVEGRNKCKACGKFARKNISDLTLKKAFHPEIESKAENFLKTKDIENKDITVYDISDKRSCKKSKYSESTSRLILASYSDKPDDKFICWINNGCVIDEQCCQLIKDKEIPSTEGIDTVLRKVNSDSGNDYWVFGS